jgi:gas vesicle protein
MRQSNYSALTVFLAGVCVGAGLGLLLAPRAGEEFREMLRDEVTRTKDDLLDRGKEAFQTAIEQGREYLEAGKREVRGATKSTAKSR